MALADMLTSQTTLAAVLVLLISSLVRFFSALYENRTKINGLPMPPRNFIFGHIMTMGKLIASLPPDIHPHVLVHYLKEKYNLPDIFYIDTWPFGHPICAIINPDVAQQVTVQHSLPKHPALDSSIWPLTGHNSLVSLNGSEHKRWREVFNPGFSNTHLMTLVGGIVDDCLVFKDILAKHAGAQDIFALEEEATKVTIDVIGRVILDAPMNAQISENDFVSAFRNQLKWLPKENEINPFKMFNPMRPLVYKYNEWRMNRYLIKVMNERFAARYNENFAEEKKQSRPVIDLALDVYLAEDSDGDKEKRNRAFIEGAIEHFKVFMFGGHDTTSSTICWVAHALATHPECLKKFRQECDEVFGSDVSKTAQKIKDDPHCINRLPYTVAIIKETLRLWPAASSVRIGEPGFFLQHEGRQYPTEGRLTWPVVHAIHRSPSLWPSSTEFLPERFLAKEGDPLFPVRGAWRAFEFGPRNCIGQVLAMLETKIIMTLMLREFTIEVAYEELDRERGVKGNMRTPEGDRVYQVLIATAKPVDGMPCRVKRM